MKYLILLGLLISSSAIPRTKDNLFRILGTRISCKYYTNGNILKDCTESSFGMFEPERYLPVIYNATNIIGPEE